MWVFGDTYMYLSLGTDQPASLGEGEDAGRCSSSMTKYQLCSSVRKPLRWWVVIGYRGIPS